MAIGNYKRLDCSVSLCDGEHKAKGYCLKHYRQHQRGGIKGDPSNCAHCSKAFVPFNVQAMYCSKACKIAAWKLRTGYVQPTRDHSQTVCAIYSGYCCDCGVAVVAARRRTRCDSCRRLYEASKAQLYSRLAAEAIHRAAARTIACDECAVVLSPLYGSSHATLCSCCVKVRDRRVKRIARLRRDAMKRGAEADSIDPIKVFERDKWRCHICNIKTPRNLRGTYDDRAPELEHIVSLSGGGSHTWGNVACSCRKCNGAKGAASYGQLGLRIAA